MSLFAATSGWEGLLVLVGFMVVSAIANWLKGKRPTGDGTDTYPRDSQPPPLGRQPAPRTRPVPSERPRSLNWEEELRRILGEESAAPAPPPPIIARQTPPPPAARPVAAAPKRLATFEESSTAYRRAEQLDETTEEHVHQRAAMSESATAYQHAATLDTKIEERLREVTESPVVMTRAARRGTPSLEIVQTVALLRQPRTARQAVLASVIMAPPKALETTGL